MYLTRSIRQGVCTKCAVSQICPVRNASASFQRKQRKGKASGTTTKHFVDFKRIRVIGGNGGDGCRSFLSLPRNEWAGPDGGDGGNGGHIIFRADMNMKSLEHVNSLYLGNDGIKGKPQNCHGRNAPHTVVRVPVGTVIKDENHDVLGSLVGRADLFVAARGGAGGHGNQFFLTNESRAPVTHEKGAVGEEKLVFAELQIMADIGLVGFPNVGKSMLLRTLSRARPKVASYPFTTLNPHVGMVEYEDHKQVAVADIPGLVKDAHLNKGLGFSFLRHIQRCSCLLYVLDLASPEPWTQLDALQYELEKYQEGLSQRPAAIVANKTDMPFAWDNYNDLRKRVPLPIIAVSARYRRNIDKLLVLIRELYDEHKKEPD